MSHLDYFFDFGIEDVFGLTPEDMQRIRMLGIRNLHQLLKYKLNEFFCHFKIEDMKDYAAALSGNMLPNAGLMEYKTVILDISNQHYTLRDNGARFELTLFSNSSDIRTHNMLVLTIEDLYWDIEWQKLLKDYILLGSKFDHDTIFSKLQGKVSLTRYRINETLQSGQNPTIDLLANYIKEIYFIQRSMISYSKQFLRSSTKPGSERRTANNPPKL